jgi:hypothetical protein
MHDRPPNELVVSEEAVSDGTVIWRYFKCERFVDILKTHSLWFSRPLRFEDQWEGLFPPAYVRRTRQYAEATGIPCESTSCKRRWLRIRSTAIGRIDGAGTGVWSPVQLHPKETVSSPGAAPWSWPAPGE